MKLHKILSVLVACIAISTNAFAADEAAYPKATIEELTNTEILTNVGDKFNLDYGVSFTYDATQDQSGTTYDEFNVDYEITFSEDVVAILAGSYGAYSNGAWIAIKSNNPGESIGPINYMGFKFEKGKTYRVVYDCLGTADVDNKYQSHTVSYSMIKELVKTFSCGVKFNENTPDNTQVTVQLCMYDNTTDDGSVGNGVTIGEAVTYTYETAEEEAITTTADYGYYAEAADAEPTGGAVSFNSVYNNFETVKPTEIGMYLYATGDATKQAFVNAADVSAMENGEFNALISNIPAEALNEVFIAMPYVIVDGEVITGTLCTVDGITAGKWLGVAADAQ